MAGLVAIGAIVAVLACLTVGYSALVEGFNTPAARGILLVGLGFVLLVWLLAHTSFG
jgi:hypothetical protein